MKKKLTTSLVLAMVLVLLAAGVALAWGLRYSHDVTATSTARSAVMEKYGLSRNAMDMFWPVIESGDHGTTVRFTAHDVFGESLTQAGTYTVTIAKDASAAVQWTHDDVDPATWASGSLDDAVWGEKQILAYRAKRDQENQTASERGVSNDVLANDGIAETGAATIPQQGKLTEEQAFDIAKTAMKETFGFSDETLTLFDVYGGLGEQQSGAWVVVYRPTSMVKSVLLTSEDSLLGDYAVTISDKTGTVLGARWSLEGKDEKIYTEHTWGQASAYSAKMLPWVSELVNTCAPLIQKGEASGVALSVEDRAAYDQAFRDAGFDETTYNHVLPQAGDISYEQAVEIVAQVLSEECGVSRAVFDASGFAYADLTQEKDHRAWYFWVQNIEEQCGWTVVFNAETGEILSVVADPFANSNG